MKTYQDIQRDLNNGKTIPEEVEAIIKDYEGSALCQNAQIANEYFIGNNVTIRNFEKFVYDTVGNKIPDIWSPNHKIACHLYKYLVIQLTLYLLGNGVSFNDENTKKKLGKTFDQRCAEALTEALNGSVSFTFVNKDHIDVFTAREFAPLYDEETGALRAGVRWWQLEADRPIRATLYEEDGYTEFIKPKDGEMQILKEKRPYILHVAKSEATGEQIVDGENYPSFPIVPLYNYKKRSELDGNRPVFDAIDLLTSGFANNVDAGEIIYWMLKNSGGMSQPDITKLIQQLKMTHVLAVDEDDEITPHSPDVKFQASEAVITRLRQQAFDNAMGLDVRQIAGSAATATQIKAAYEPLNSKTDLIEMQVTEWILGILKVLDIDDEPTYTRSMIVNRTEEINTLSSAADHLSEEYVSGKILELLGDIDKKEEVKLQRIAEGAERMIADNENELDIENTDAVDVSEDVAETSDDVKRVALNGAQVQAMIGVIESFASGALTRQQAINILVISFGLSESDARSMIEGEAVEINE